MKVLSITNYFCPVCWQDLITQAAWKTGEPGVITAQHYLGSGCIHAGKKWIVKPAEVDVEEWEEEGITNA